MTLLERLTKIRDSIPEDQIVALAAMGEVLTIVEDHRQAGSFYQASPSYLRMRGALRRLARGGCSRLVDPSTCRKPNGYPREEWCDGCVAADGLGLPVEWYVLHP